MLNGMIYFCLDQELVFQEDVIKERKMCMAAFKATELVELMVVVNTNKDL